MSILDSRKIRIWFITFVAVAAMFIAYTMLSKTPKGLNIETEWDVTQNTNNANNPVSEANFGRVGDVEVGELGMAIFTRLNPKTKKIEQKFGFKKLLHEEGNEWEIEKPFMIIYRDDLECHIRADKGFVQVESGRGMKADPGDATLIGNVIIHIVPTGQSDIKESYIFIDKIDYLSERSRFSTQGPVTFVSKDIRMIGRGLEIVYNELAERLELLKIRDLESLRLKKPAQSVVEDEQAQTEPLAVGIPAEPVHQQVAKQPVKTHEDKPKDKRQTFYRCVISDNVVIETMDELVYAAEIYINDILFSGNNKRNSTAETKAEHVRQRKSTDVTSQNISDTKQTTSLTATQTADLNQDEVTLNIPEPNETIEFIEEPTDIILTCSKGVLVTPMDSKIKPPLEVTKARAPENFEQAGGRSVITANRINFSVPAEQVELVGDCVCTSFDQAVGFNKKNRLAAPRVLVKLKPSESDKSKDAASGIEYLTAGNGIVQLDTSKWIGTELLGFSKLKCLNIEFDGIKQILTATGPDGKIAIDNSKLTVNDEQTDRIGLQKQCYALIQGFETMKYFLVPNKIQLNAVQGDLINIDYSPVVDGQLEQQVAATAVSIEADLEKTAEGVTELSNLRAHGGISYEDPDVYFVADYFNYDSNQSCIKAWSEAYQECFLNGIRVDGIEYDLKTGKAENKILGPGMFEIK
ncbi:MAG: hypothetical protein ACYTBV_02935 [Planctomycetota bacterium]